MRVSICFFTVLFASSVAAAPSLTKGLSHGQGSPTEPSQANMAGCGTTNLTQSSSQTITSGNSASCNNGGIHTDNYYSRVFGTAVIPTGFSICQVQVGVELASSNGGEQPLTVNLYSHTGAAYPNGTLTPVGTANSNVTDQAATIISVPVSGSVSAGDDLVVEIFTPEGSATNNSLFIGSNQDAETGPSFFKASPCGVSVPTPTSELGFPNMHVVLNVLGTPGGGIPTAIPTLSQWALLLMALLLAASSAWYGLQRSYRP